jgi:hypothetical protein
MLKIHQELKGEINTMIIPLSPGNMSLLPPYPKLSISSLEMTFNS